MYKNELIDEAHLFFPPNDFYAKKLKSSSKPTLLLTGQDIKLLAQKRIRRKKSLRHNEKIVKALKNELVLNLKQRYGNFSLKDNLLDTQKVRLLITDEFFSKIVTKKRIFKKR